RVRRRPTHGPDEDIVGTVLDTHQRGLADRASFVAGVGYDDHRKPGVAERGTFGPATALVEFDLIAHPLPGAGNVLCHGASSLHPAKLAGQLAVRSTYPPARVSAKDDARGGLTGTLWPGHVSRCVLLLLMSDLHTMITPSRSSHCLTDDTMTQARNDSPAARLSIRTVACYTAATRSDGTTPCGAEPYHRTPSQTAGAVWLRHILARVYPEERKYGENQAYRPDHPRPGAGRVLLQKRVRDDRGWAGWQHPHLPQ